MSDVNDTTAAGDSTAQADVSSQTSTDTGTQVTTDQSQTSSTGDNLDASKETQSTNSSKDEGKSETSTPVIDADIDDWAEKTGRPKPTTDQERALLQEIRNDRREQTRKANSKEATKAMADTMAKSAPKPESQDYDDPLEKRVAAAEAKLEQEQTTRVQESYIAANNVSSDEVRVMGEVLDEMVEEASTPEEKQNAFKFLTSPKNLAHWHALAKARMATQDTSQVQAEAARKERERIARESQAGADGRNAKATVVTEQSEDAARLERFKKW